jgi:AGCS family alanine or glycine:cation symporter
MTGLVIVVTGVLPSGEVGASLTATAFQAGLPGPGDLIVTVSILFFAFTTILVAEFYSETGAVYCFGNKSILPVRIIFLAAVVIGSIGGLRIVWGLLDLFMGITVAINLIVIVLLRKKVVELTKDFFNNVLGMKE